MRHRFTHGLATGESNPESSSVHSLSALECIRDPTLLRGATFNVERLLPSPFNSMVPKWSMGFAGRDDLATHNVLAKC
jgi:hypothetical protein